MHVLVKWSLWFVVRSIPNYKPLNFLHQLETNLVDLLIVVITAQVSKVSLCVK
jgi:hypothetical protein